MICIEILSRRDEISDVLEKLEEYATARVRYIQVADPRRKKAPLTMAFLGGYFRWAATEDRSSSASRSRLKSCATI